LHVIIGEFKSGRAVPTCRLLYVSIADDKAQQDSIVCRMLYALCIEPHPCYFT